MDIVIIGAQKAGTTWLFEMLRQQPRVGTSFRKEVHYFDYRCKPKFNFERYKKNAKERTRRQLKISGPDFRAYIKYCLNEETAFTDEWYRNTFLLKPENQQKLERGETLVFLEGSPSYMSMPEEGIAHMARALSGIEPILMIRDPVRRMISGLTMDIARREDEAVSQRFIDSRIVKEQIPRGNYSRALPLFRKHFKGVHIIPFRSIQTRPLEVLREIEKKYGLDTIEYNEVAKKLNSKTGMVEFSAETIKQINSVCEAEYDYLRSEFGPEFLNDI